MKQSGTSIELAPSSLRAEQPPIDVLDLQDYVPYFIRAIANKLSQASSRQYGERFGIGLNEWACLALLARESDITAGRISEVGGYDKAVISRSIGALIEKGHVRSEPVPNHNRRRLLRLTKSGRKVYSEIRVLALTREAKLLEGISHEDQQQLLEILRRLIVNAQKIDQ